MSCSLESKFLIKKKEFFKQDNYSFNFYGHAQPTDKKGQAEQKQEEILQLLGRPGNTLKMGLIGCPNVGKSSTFNFLVNQSVPADNYPFCTVDPNQAFLKVEDSRFNLICEKLKPKKSVYPQLEIFDIAGLVPKAHKGEGLGNQFLSHIRQVDGLYHVVRAFENDEIINTQNTVDPVRDIEIVNTEIALKDLNFVDNRISTCKKDLIKHLKNKELQDEYTVLQKIRENLNNNKWIRQLKWTADDIQYINKNDFLTSKPMIYLLNVSSEDYLQNNNKWIKDVQDFVQENQKGEVLQYSVEYEQKINNPLDPTSSINKIIKSGYDNLNLIHFFTIQENLEEAKCWTIRKNTLAPQAAGVIHTDFEQGFIAANIITFEQFAQLKNLHDIKILWKQRKEGKNYVMQDGDIALFHFNVSKSNKK